MRKQTRLWTTKAGAKLRICDMSDTHLAKAIACLERSVKTARDSALHAAYQVAPMLQGEMASFYIEQDIDSMEEDPDGENFLPAIYDNLCEERDRRDELRVERQNAR
jgi:hypothetical protein